MQELFDKIFQALKKYLKKDYDLPGTGYRPAQWNISGQSRANDYRQQTSHSKPQPKYTTQEVKRILRGLDHSPRAIPVMNQAARLGNLLDEGMRRHFLGRERLFDRLPYVLLQYTQGKPSQEIARSVSYFANGEDVETAMDFAARLITRAVNRSL